MNTFLSVSFKTVLFRFFTVCCPFLYHFLFRFFGWPFLLRFHSLFPFCVFDLFSYFLWGKEEGARSRVQGGNREDRAFPLEPRDNFSKQSRARDDHSALFHVIWESMRRMLSHLEASSFLFCFQNVSLSLLYCFFTVSLPFLYRFRLHFFSVSTIYTISFPFPANKKKR